MKYKKIRYIFRYCKYISVFLSALLFLFANSTMATSNIPKSFATEATIAILTTNVISNIAQTTATCGGNITNDGGATVTERQGHQFKVLGVGFFILEDFQFR